MIETQISIKNNKVVLPDSILKNDSGKMYLFFCNRTSSQIMRRLGLTKKECEQIIDSSNVNCRLLTEAQCKKLSKDIERVCPMREKQETANREIFRQMTSSNNNRFEIPYMFKSYFCAGEFIALTTEKGEQITEIWDKTNISKVKVYLKEHKKTIKRTQSKTRLIGEVTVPSKVKSVTKSSQSKTSKATTKKSIL